VSRPPARKKIKTEFVIDLKTVIQLALFQERMT